jgi:aspartyl-tRNA(Asn)/glutamyl-tRNA(Gln) amidotransferase subunit A
LDHVGPITRTVADNMLALSALAGDAFQPEAEGISGLRVGVVRHFPATPNIVAAIETALETLKALQAVVVEIRLDTLDVFRECGWTILKAEAFGFHRRRFKMRPEDYGSAARRVLSDGARISRDGYMEAQRTRLRLRADTAAAMQDIDILVTAVTPAPACRLDDLDAMEKSGDGSLRIPFNVTGNPALALPIGFTPEGLPLSMQLVGKPRSESTVYRVAQAYEAATKWHQRRPEFISPEFH